MPPQRNLRRFFYFKSKIVNADSWSHGAEYEFDNKVLSME